MYNMAQDAEDVGLDLFQEPDDFYPPEKEATFASHTLLSGKELTIRLVGHNPLWVRFPCCQSRPSFSVILAKCSSDVTPAQRASPVADSSRVTSYGMLGERSRLIWKKAQTS